jgi:diguanylate cyclase (GGDEF)-like protein
LIFELWLTERFYAQRRVAPSRAAFTQGLGLMSTNRVNILLVDDDPALLRLLSKWLESGGYETRHAEDGQQAITAITSRCPSILITDWEMPHVDGLELCRWLRRQLLPHYLYTIFLTQRTASEYMVQALETGADDFLKKPVNKAELLARVRSGVRVLELESRLSVLARTDPLTGLATRRTFLEKMESEWSRSRRHHIPLSCVMIDIDFFKRINDTYGHRAGDDMLRKTTKVLQESCRGSDIVGRYGGEEFCVLLPETTEINATHWADRVRRQIANQARLEDYPHVSMTASFGVAQRLADTESAEQLVDLADQALLVAKRSGRDRVVAYQSIQDSSQLRSTGGGPEAIFRGLKARNVMNTVVAGLHQDETVGRAASYFLRFRFHSAPVVDDDGQLVGILSERDVMTAMLWPRWWETSIKEVMKHNVVCYEEDTPVVVIYEFLCRVSIRGIVIVRDGQPSGMISRNSLLRWFTNLLTLNSSASREGSTPDRSPDQVLGSRLEPRENVALIVRAMSEEVRKLESRLEGETTDLVPVVIGGVSRLEELINDLLAASRYTQCRQPPGSTVHGATAVMEATVKGVVELTEAIQLPDAALCNAPWLPPAWGAHVPGDSGS